MHRGALKTNDIAMTPGGTELAVTFKPHHSC